MKKIIEISNSWTNEEQQLLKQISIDVEIGFNRIQLTEDQFAVLSKMIDLKNAIIGKGTMFTTQEINDAEQGFLFKIKALGYPQPESNFGFLYESFDLDNYCQMCGIGAKQIKPIRIKKEIIWKSPSLGNLNWLFDQIFVQKEFYHQFFEPKGISCFPVLLDNSSNHSKTTVQLNIEESNFDLELTDDFVVCNNCNRRKYNPQQFGFFHGYDICPDNILKTKEYFGNGALAFQRIVLPKSIISELLQKKIIKFINIVPSERELNQIIR